MMLTTCRRGSAPNHAPDPWLARHTTTATFVDWEALRRTQASQQRDVKTQEATEKRNEGPQKKYLRTYEYCNTRARIRVPWSVYVHVYVLEYNGTYWSVQPPQQATVLEYSSSVQPPQHHHVVPTTTRSCRSHDAARVLQYCTPSIGARAILQNHEHTVVFVCSWHRSV